LRLYSAGVGCGWLFMSRGSWRFCSSLTHFGGNTA